MLGMNLWLAVVLAMEKWLGFRGEIATLIIQYLSTSIKNVI